MLNKHLETRPLLQHLPLALLALLLAVAGCDGGDDDDTAIDFDSIPPPHVDEDEYEAIRGRECAAHAGGAAAPATAALLIGLALIALRRRA